QHDFLKLLHIGGSERLLGFASVTRGIFKVRGCRKRRGDHAFTITSTAARRAAPHDILVEPWGIRAAVLFSTHLPDLVTQPILSEARSLAAVIDHTLLKPDAMAEDITRVCEEAAEFGFAAVCVNPCWVTLAANLLGGSGARVCTVVGFPLGANTTRTKVYEAGIAGEQGAIEIDMVLNIGALRDGAHHLVHKDISDVAEVVRGNGGLLKVILETS